MEPVDEVYNGKAMIAVYGAGYVGLSLAAVYLRHGMHIVLVDIDADKLRRIREKKFRYIEKDTEEAINMAIENGMIEFTTDGVEASRKSRVKVVAVPVRLDWDTKEIDYTPLVSALRNIAAGLKRGDLIIIESSVPPGTTEEIARPLLEEVSGLRAEEDFFLAYSPERIYVGRAVKDIEENYPKIVAGVGPRSTEAAAKFYERIARKGVIRLKRPRDAEFEKLAEGIYRDVNIALANELAIAAMMLGVDFYAAREAANTQPYSHIHLPGPGVGGYCIPIYPYFLVNKLLEKHYIPSLILMARSINEQMPLKVVKLVDNLAQSQGIDKQRAKVALLGVAFRGETDDTRLSPSHDVAALLKARGFHNIIAHDPYVRRDETLEGLGIPLTNNLSEALAGAELIIVLTRHKAYRELSVSDIVILSKTQPIIVDTVNILKKNEGIDLVRSYIVLGIPSDNLSSL